MHERCYGGCDAFKSVLIQSLVACLFVFSNLIANSVLSLFRSDFEKVGYSHYMYYTYI